MKAVFPGSFDPITNGHLDLIERSAALFDQVIVLVADNRSKASLFDLDQRLTLIRQSIAGFSNVSAAELQPHELTVQAAQRWHAAVIVRGVRNENDFAFEQAVADVNHHLNPRIETVLLPSRGPYQHLSSSLVREIASYQGNLSGLVPPCVQQALIRISK